MDELPDYNPDGSANPKGDAAYWRARAEQAEEHVRKLEIALAEIRDLARTGLPIDGYTPEMWAQHRTYCIAGMANFALTNGAIASRARRA